MTFLNHDDNRIVIASLECLQVLLKLMPLKFHLFFLKPGSMSESFLNAKYLSLLKSKNQDSTKDWSAKGPNLDLNDSHLNMSMIDITTQGSTETTSAYSGSVESLNTLKSSSNPSHQPYMTNSTIDLNSEFSLDTQLDSLPTNNPLIQASDNAETKTLVEQSDLNSLPNDDVEELNPNFEKFLNENDSIFPFKGPTELIGDFYSVDKQPITYFVRFVSYKYLFNLNYNPNQNEDDSKNLTKLKSDSECKVLVKAIALDCCASCITLQLNILFNSLCVEKSGQPIDDLFFYDLIGYVNHPDDKMKTTACLFIGQLISSVLIENEGNYDYWLEKMVDNR